MAVEQVGPGLGPLEDPALLLLDHLPVVVGQHVPGGVGGQLHHPHPLGLACNTACAGQLDVQHEGQQGAL